MGKRRDVDSWLPELLAEEAAAANQVPGAAVAVLAGDEPGA